MIFQSPSTLWGILETGAACWNGVENKCHQMAQRFNTINILVSQRNGADACYVCLRARAFCCCCWLVMFGWLSTETFGNQSKTKVGKSAFLNTCHSVGPKRRCTHTHNNAVQQMGSRTYLYGSMLRIWHSPKRKSGSHSKNDPSFVFVHCFYFAYSKCSQYM